MSDKQEPVVLELAPLPREKLGPFLILGVEKDAGKEQIEANWARRIIWARKSQYRVTLEDVNWAREAINDPERRPRADASTLNVDTSERVIHRLEQRHTGDGPERPLRLGWQPLDVERPLADYRPGLPVPSPEEVRLAIRVPDVPPELPVAQTLLDELTRTPLDPWALPADLEASG